MGEVQRLPEQQNQLYAGDTFKAITRLPEIALKGARDIFEKLVNAVRKKV